MGVVIEPLVDPQDYRDAGPLVAVILRDNVTADGFHETRLAFAEEANGRNVVDPIENYLPCFCVPELLLIESAESRDSNRVGSAS